VGSNQSPTGSEDTVFSHVDLTAWSVGVSGALGKFQFAAGLNQQSGMSRDVTLTNLLNGQPVLSPISVRLTGFIYSLAYQF
jgi:predicted porin